MQFLLIITNSIEFVYVDDFPFPSLDFFLLSSNSILTDGDSVSSYWPDLTAQIKAIRKITAIIMLNIISNKITGIRLDFSF